MKINWMRFAAPPRFYMLTGQLLPWLWLLSALLAAAGLYVGFFVAPTDFQQGEGYRIQITGEPHVHLELSVSSDLGDHNHAGCLATAMHVINALPHVIEAAPGVLTTLDLPVYSARHLMV